MRVLVAGDSYLPVDGFRERLEGLGLGYEVEFLQLREDIELTPTTPSELRIREYIGTPSQLVERMSATDVLVVHAAPVTREVLTASPNLRLVCCARGGPVNVDVEAASDIGVSVATTPGKNARAVAELTVAFMIMLARRLPRALREAAVGGLGASAMEGARHFGSEIRGSTLGLVGYGHVGRLVALDAQALGLEVAAVDPYKEVGDGVRQARDLGELLMTSDFVSVHVRATADNENLFGAREFAAMRPGSFFINTARETLVDEDALCAALRSGHLAGAALDVVRPRALAGPHPLLAFDNVAITPHLGGATHETLSRGVAMVAAELRRLARDEPLRFVINGRGA